MKELFSIFSGAVFYPFVSLGLPGLTATIGWLIYFMSFPSFRVAVGKSHTETAFALMLLSIFVGTVIDDIGTRLESICLDRWRNSRTHGKHQEEWWAYLRKPFTVETSGRRHLRRLVVRLKFELGVSLGIAITCPSVWLNSAMPFRWATGTTVFGLLLFFYLMLEAIATHEVLGILRHELLKEAGGATQLDCVGRLGSTSDRREPLTS